MLEQLLQMIWTYPIGSVAESGDACDLINIVKLPSGVDVQTWLDFLRPFFLRCYDGQ